MLQPALSNLPPVNLAERGSEQIARQTRAKIRHHVALNPLLDRVRVTCHIRFRVGIILVSLELARKLLALPIAALVVVDPQRNRPCFVVGPTVVCHVIPPFDSIRLQRSPQPPCSRTARARATACHARSRARHTSAHDSSRLRARSPGPRAARRSNVSCSLHESRKRFGKRTRPLVRRAVAGCYSLDTETRRLARVWLRLCQDAACLALGHVG